MYCFKVQLQFSQGAWILILFLMSDVFLHAYRTIFGNIEDVSHRGDD